MQLLDYLSTECHTIIQSAKTEARALGFGAIEPEHELLGILREHESEASKLLVSLGMTLDGTRKRIEELTGRGDAGPSRGSMPFTPNGQRVIELAHREAIAEETDTIYPEHMLFGLLRLEGGVASEVLEDFGVQASLVRMKLRNIKRPLQPTAAEAAEAGKAWIPLSSGLAGVLDRARQLATHEGASSVTTGHLARALADGIGEE